MTLELCEADGTGALAENGLYPAARIIADDSEELWMELYPGEAVVRIPLSEVERAIALARKDVHGEPYYDDATPPERDADT